MDRCQTTGYASGRFTVCIGANALASVDSCEAAAVHGHAADAARIATVVQNQRITRRVAAIAIVAVFSRRAGTRQLCTFIYYNRRRLRVYRRRAGHGTGNRRRAGSRQVHRYCVGSQHCAGVDIDRRVAGLGTIGRNRKVVATVNRAVHVQRLVAAEDRYTSTLDCHSSIDGYRIAGAGNADRLIRTVSYQLAALVLTRICYGQGMVRSGKVNAIVRCRRG